MTTTPLNGTERVLPGGIVTTVSDSPVHRRSSIVTGDGSRVAERGVLLMYVTEKRKLHVTGV